jgi:hypothetical protein
MFSIQTHITLLVTEDIDTCQIGATEASVGQGARRVDIQARIPGFGKSSRVGVGKKCQDRDDNRPKKLHGRRGEERLRYQMCKAGWELLKTDDTHLHFIPEAS